MAPRKFEELVAAIFRAKRYTVELTPATRDGGFDMRASHRNDVGLFMTLIECKRYLPKNRVSVDVVRGLYGVTENERANLPLSQQPFFVASFRQTKIQKQTHSPSSFRTPPSSPPPSSSPPSSSPPSASPPASQKLQKNYLPIFPTT